MFLQEVPLRIGVYLWRWNCRCVMSSICLKLASGVSSMYLFQVLTWSPSSLHLSTLRYLSQKHPCEVGKCYYSHFYTGNWGTEGLKITRYVLSRTVTGNWIPSHSSCFLRALTTESSCSSAPLLIISTRVCIVNVKPSTGSTAKSKCSSPQALPPPFPDKSLWVSQAVWLHREWHLHLSDVLTSVLGSSSDQWHKPTLPSLLQKVHLLFSPRVPQGSLWLQGHWPIFLPILVLRSVTD